MRCRWRTSTSDARASIAGRAAAVLALLVAGCVGSVPRGAHGAARPAFDPIAFFAGPTHGTGRLRIALSRPHAVEVRGSGDLLPDGTLHLAQTVTRDGHAPTRRAWTIRRAGPGRWTGSLSDAAGPVAVAASGDRLHIRYRMAHGLAAEQWLVLEAGGQAARNRLTVRKLGVAVAVLDERIVREP